MEYVKPKPKSAKTPKNCKVQVIEIDTEADISCESLSSSEEKVVVKKKVKERNFKM